MNEKIRSLTSQHEQSGDFTHVRLTGTMLFVEATLRARSLGLPPNLLVVEDCDEWLYCIDCDNGKVVSWSQVDGVRDEYPDFDTFLLQDLEDAIANM
ncbi:SMI1/KNR4 family protein [Paratractidigestivibacter sp.]|uniref:SMI1/KNR4 family protein n=1 Tax=Paratractidigestivibacter sp. TaxID=2847316 RepID=UPI002ABDD03E|nr:SMI1/KNR4 family protein [Paratractidigestivibacter sp.]